jgi:putative copper export protein
MENNAEASPVLATLELLWEALIAVALAFWTGILVVEGIVLSGKAQRSILFILSRKRSQPLQWVCLSILLVAEVIVLILRAAQVAQSPGGSAFNLALLGQLLVQPAYGFFWIAREMLIVASMGLLWWTTDRPEQPLTVLPLALAGLILPTYAFSPDAGQLLPQPTLLDPQFSLYADILNWFAFAAQCVWFGTLAYLGYVLLSLLPLIEPEQRAGTLLDLLQRSRPLMLATLGVLFFSELFLTEMYFTVIIPSNTRPLIDASYERVLLVAWLSMVLMLLLSAYEFFVLRPKLVRQASVFQPAQAGGVQQRPARQIALERKVSGVRQVLIGQTGLAVIVLLCTVLAAFFPPALPVSSQNSAIGASTDLSSTQTKQVGNLAVTLSVAPAKIDVANTVTIKITDTRSGQPVTAARIVMSINMVVMDMGTVRATLVRGTPVYSTTFAKDTTFSMTGIWEIILTIQMPNQAQETVSFQIWFTG